MDFSLIDKCIGKQIEALVNLQSLVRNPDYEEVLQVLTDVANSNYSRRIIVAGVGKNSFIAEKAMASMASLGIPAMPLNITHCAHGDFGAVGDNDVIIHVSRSGKTKEMLEAIYHISNIKPKVVQILLHCNSKKEPSQADYELWCGDVQEGDEFSLAPTTSTTVLLCMLDTISVELSRRIGFTALDFYKYHPGGSLGASFKKVGFVYKTIDLTTGKEYIGYTTLDPRVNHLGTGDEELERLIEVHGALNFKRVILGFYQEDELEQKALEARGPVGE